MVRIIVLDGVNSSSLHLLTRLITRFHTNLRYLIENAAKAPSKQKRPKAYFQEANDCSSKQENQLYSAAHHVLH